MKMNSGKRSHAEHGSEMNYCSSYTLKLTGMPWSVKFGQKMIASAREKIYFSECCESRFSITLPTVSINTDRVAICEMGNAFKLFTNSVKSLP